MLEERNDLAIGALVAQIRSTAVNILRRIGMNYNEALSPLGESVARPKSRPKLRRSYPPREH